MLVSANDELVNLFLNHKIKFNDIFNNLNKILNLKSFNTFKQKTPKNPEQIYKLNKYVRLKTRSLSIL